MTTVRRFGLALPALLAVGPAFAQLGGTEGVIIPYRGILEKNGAPQAGTFEFNVRIFNQELGGAACFTQPSALSTTLAGGHFSLLIGPVPEACVKGQNLWVELDVKANGDATFTPMNRRQRIHAAPAAVTSGTGDFYVHDSLTGPNGLVIVAGDLEATGALRADNVTATTVNATSTETGSLNVTGATTTRSIAATGTVTWDCPTGTVRAGIWCITNSQGTAGSETAIANCHAQKMTLCPLEAIMACDAANIPNECGALTDQGNTFPSAPDRNILTSTYWKDEGDQFGSAFGDLICYVGQWRNVPTSSGGTTTYVNFTGRCGSGSDYFCCAPISPR